MRLSWNEVRVRAAAFAADWKDAAYEKGEDAELLQRFLRRVSECSGGPWPATKNM